MVMEETSFQGKKKVHVVLGSESCDLDSVVSSLAMAYFLSRTSGPPGGSLVLPVLNVPRSQFHLRAEVLLLLREAGVAPETLVFRDEVDLGRLHGDRRLALTLVDHHVLPSTYSCLEGAVVEVIDHQQLETTTSFSCHATMEVVASCTTLVTDRILSRAPEILDRQLALLLYGVMVVDSAILSPQVGKGTIKDSQMVLLLQTQFPDLPHRGALHTSLHTAKFDLSGLSTEQILLKDMRTVYGGGIRVAVSNVYTSLDSFLRRENLQQQLCDFCRSHRLDAVVAMMISFNDQSDEPIRQLAVYSSSSQYRQEISHALVNNQSPAPCLSPVTSPYKDILAYHQGNALASRRKLLPVLTHFLSHWWQREVHCGADGGEVLEDQLDQSEVMVSDTDLADDLLPHGYSISRHHRRRLQMGAEDYGNVEEDHCGRTTPPAPMNSLVDGCPLDGGFNQEALLEKFNRMGGVEEEQGGSGR
ncbi:exopolyphosphatase PRUNE1-like isoform X2 [Micropterus salmoides]|uniref:exopolyphosphatase PRUNE1-like isoform X2 n=1 Tax=Micropterus salmoides TaxID=27706 RepID=UPI0018EB125F|nr:exopolyphosphatase PRUNE1-like isoform X2 [Micropterus salmoides]